MWPNEWLMDGHVTKRKNLAYKQRSHRPFVIIQGTVRSFIRERIIEQKSDYFP